ncbi:MAG: CHAT domain-containing protein, partial [Acidobacteria bacterium]|nr:CHAT domain-containing protein [Acidobacteriota bacterium]
MSFTLRASFCFLALSLTFIGPPLAQSQSTSSAPAAQHSADEAALRALAEAFFRAWAAKDLDGFLRIWSAKSPTLESHKQAMQKLFVNNEKIEVKNLMVYKVTVDGEKARLRVDVEINAVEAKTGNPASGFGSRKLVIDCVKENGSWRVWHEESAFVILARALEATAIEKERDTLLENEKDLWSAPLTTALNNEGIRYGSQGLYPRAMNAFRIAQSIAEKINDSPGLVQALNNIGLVHIYQSNYNLALEPLQKSLRLAEAIGNQRSISIAWNNLGMLYKGQGNFSLAMESYRKVLEIAQTRGDKTAIAFASGNIGNIHIDQGNYSLAAEYYQKSQAHYRESGEKAGEGRILHSLGSIQVYQGNNDLALKFFKESLALKEEAGNRVEQARTLSSLGGLSLVQGNYDLAEEYYRKSLAIHEASDVRVEIANTFHHLGDLYFVKGDHNLALEYFQKSLGIYEAIGEKEGEGHSLIGLANVYLQQGKPAQALEASERATEIAKHIVSLEMLWTALTHTGKAHRRLTHPAQARQAFEEAIITIEALRTQVAGGEREMQGSFENKVSAYHELVRLLIDQNQFGEALAYAERAKGRALLDVLQHGRAGIEKAMTIKEREEERRLKSELTQINTQLTRATQSNKPDAERISEIKAQLEKARRNYEAFQTSLYAAHPELKVQRGEASIIKAEELTALVPDTKSALLEYVVADDRTYLFAIAKAVGRAKAEVQVYTIPIKRAELAKHTESFRGQLAGRDLGFHASAHKLYDLLLKPAQALLRSKSSLIFVPDDMLWELPFQALLAGDGRFVIENSAVAFAPSLTVLREIKAQRNKRQF